LENKILAPVSDRKRVQFLLQSGLFISMLLMVIGLSINIFAGHIEAVSIPMFELMSESLSLGNRFLGFGVLVLALTPAFRVVTLTVLWAQEKDWKFVGISLLVLLALIISVSLGGHG